MGGMGGDGKEICMLAENDSGFKGTCLEFALEAGYPEMASKLLDKGCPIVDRDVGSGAPVQLVSLAIRLLFGTKFVSSKQESLASAADFIIKLVEKKVAVGDTDAIT